ncbi:hypothetical protein IWC96_00765 [Brevundimonas sp. BAL450]|nr:hypothetical protein [Brevundimonas sp. BAL450]
MVEDDGRETVKGLVAAERKSPPRYDAARQLFLSVLEGRMTLAQAQSYASGLPDPIDRRCAEGVMGAGAIFLKEAIVSPIGQLPPLTFPVRADLTLKISPIRVRQLEEPRLLLLHLWDRPLNERQIRAALAILKRGLLEQAPDYAYCDVDFVILSTQPLSAHRSCRVYEWPTLPAMKQEELNQFLEMLTTAWDEYQRKGPRLIKRRHQPRLL